MTSDLAPQNRATPPTALVMRHLRAACEKRALSETAVLAGTRTRAACAARWEAVRAVYESAPGRYTKVGLARRLGLDHTTVGYALMTEEQREVRREKSRRRAAERRQ